ncbi:hypothetical protein CY34DRAFT_812803, partial [Suillus luteus UH-Slu-Lm8-n1]
MLRGRLTARRLHHMTAQSKSGGAQASVEKTRTPTHWSSLLSWLFRLGSDYGQDVLGGGGWGSARPEVPSHCQSIIGSH